MPKLINSCNVKNRANPDCCPNAVNVGVGESYIIECELENKIVKGHDWFPFPKWCPLPKRERQSA